MFLVFFDSIIYLLPSLANFWNSLILFVLKLMAKKLIVIVLSTVGLERAHGVVFVQKLAYDACFLMFYIPVYLFISFADLFLLSFVAGKIDVYVAIYECVEESNYYLLEAVVLLEVVGILHVLIET